MGGALDALWAPEDETHITRNAAMSPSRASVCRILSSSIEVRARFNALRIRVAMKKINAPGTISQSRDGASSNTTTRLY
jgi:hypothetical protein